MGLAGTLGDDGRGVGRGWTKGTADLRVVCLVYLQYKGKTFSKH